MQSNGIILLFIVLGITLIFVGAQGSLGKMLGVVFTPSMIDIQE